MKGIPFAHREFNKKFSGNFIISNDIESKLAIKHTIYSDDIENCLEDNYKIIIKNKKEKYISNKYPSSRVFDIYGEVYNKIIFLVVRMFEDGNIYIISGHWATNDEKNFYFQCREELYPDG